MGDKSKIGRNDPCPCLSGKKYKKCCEGIIRWPELIQGGINNHLPYLSARGKNLAFLFAIADALQLDNLDNNHSWGDIKRAITPRAVKLIHEALLDIWSSREDIERVLANQARQSSGLYVGDYEPELVMKGVTRHSIYADRIILIDPFMHPKFIRDEYNPILNPEKYVASTIKLLRLWWAMLPWIESGIVNFVRTPGDFDPRLIWECIDIEMDRHRRYPQIKSASEEWAKRKVEETPSLKEYMFFIQPDSHIIKTFQEIHPNASGKDIETLLQYLKKKREEHPFLPDLPDDKRNPEIILSSTGTNYEMAKRIAQISGSHLITDIKPRWIEIELDRAEANIDDGNWSAFAKAFHESKWRYLENVTLEAAINLRKERRLEDMRAFLRKVWKVSASPDQFSRENAENLSAELNERVREAEYEWSSIDRDLLKYFGGTLAAGTVAAGPAIATGTGYFVGGALVVAALAELGVSQFKRKMFSKKYPAGFFLEASKEL